MRNSRTCFSRFLIGAASLIAASTAALAGEQVLEFKLVTKAIDPKVVQASNIEGQTMSTSNAFGVAFFKDGRVAAKGATGSAFWPQQLDLAMPDHVAVRWR